MTVSGTATQPRRPARKVRVLVVRLDSMGDVLLTGAAVRAVAASGAEVTMLVGPGLGAVARLLPGVADVIEFAAPWVLFDPPSVQPGEVRRLVRRLRRGRFDRALVSTSFHQSPLPTALVLRLAGIGWIGAISVDYPGSLLDLRHRIVDGVPEAERNLSLAEAAGYPADALGASLQVRRPLPDMTALTGPEPYVVFHPGAAVSARRPTAEHSRALVSALVGAGYRVVVTGSAAESTLTGYVAAGYVAAGYVVAGCGVAGSVAAGQALDLGARLDLPQLAAVLDRAECAVAPNTGPAHLAAAVGTPVVSLFAPVVPLERWLPYGVPVRVLGDQHAPCRDTRARDCPVDGHPCLSSITPGDVVAAVEALAGTPLPSPKGG